MNNVRDNLSAALERIWAEYQRGGSTAQRDERREEQIVESMEALVHERLGEFRRKLFGEYPSHKSVLIEQLEEVLLARRGATQHFSSFYLVPAEDIVDRFRSDAQRGSWIVRPATGEREDPRCTTFASPPGTELNQAGDSNSSVTEFTIRIYADRLLDRQSRACFPLLVPSAAEWDESRGLLPEVTAVSADDQSIALADIFGAPRGQWLYPAGSILLRWWTEPARPAAGSAFERPKLRWFGDPESKGDLFANRIDLEIDLEHIQQIWFARGFQQLELTVRLPFRAVRVVSDFVRAELGDDKELVGRRFQVLFEDYFSRYAEPSLWNLVNDATSEVISGDALRGTLVTFPAHKDEGTRPTESSGESPQVSRRNILRAALRPQATLVTVEDVADAVDALLGAFGRVDRSKVIGAPTWLEAVADRGLFERLREHLQRFLGFVWIVPFISDEPEGPLARRVHSAMAAVNRRVPIGTHVVIDVRKPGAV